MSPLIVLTRCPEGRTNSDFPHFAERIQVGYPFIWNLAWITIRYWKQCERKNIVLTHCRGLLTYSYVCVGFHSIFSEHYWRQIPFTTSRINSNILMPISFQFLRKYVCTSAQQSFGNFLLVEKTCMCNTRSGDVFYISVYLCVCLSVYLLEGFRPWITEIELRICWY